MVGGSVCHKHGGRAPQVRRKAAELMQRRAAEADLAAMGYPIPTTSIEALEESLADANGNVAVLRMLVRGLGTDVYGELYHVSGWATGEAKPHVLVVMLGEWIDRKARIAKDMAALGFDERRVRLAEAQINGMVEAMTVALEVLPPSQREQVRSALVVELRRRGRLAD